MDNAHLKYEKNNNFFFVKGKDPQLYERLLAGEGLIATDIGSSGRELRNILEGLCKGIFRTSFLSESMRKEFERDYVSANLKDYENFIIDYYKKHTQRSDEFIKNFHLNFRIIRQIGNRFSHRTGSEDAGANNKFYCKRCPSNKFRPYEDHIIQNNKSTLCCGWCMMQQLLVLFYNVPCKKYLEELQPIGDYRVISDKFSLDASSCERQILAYRVEPPENVITYHLIRQYSFGIADVQPEREYDVLKGVVDGKLRGQPENIPKYEIMSALGSDNQGLKTYFLRYDFGPVKPESLDKEGFCKGLDLNQKYTVLKDIANGIYELHKNKIYHRNLLPGNIFVQKTKEEIKAMVVGFEFAKDMNARNNNLTVIGSLMEHNSEVDINRYFSQEYINARDNKAEFEKLNWDKEDIYCLGSVFYYVLMGTDPPSNTKSIDTSKVDSITKDDRMGKLIKSMREAEKEERPSAEDVLRRLSRIAPL